MTDDRRRCAADLPFGTVRWQARDGQFLPFMNVGFGEPQRRSHSVCPEIGAEPTSSHSGPIPAALIGRAELVDRPAYSAPRVLHEQHRQKEAQVLYKRLGFARSRSNQGLGRPPDVFSCSEYCTGRKSSKSSLRPHARRSLQIAWRLGNLCQVSLCRRTMGKIASNVGLDAAT